jgi:hypothetical protein
MITDASAIMGALLAIEVRHNLWEPEAFGIKLWPLVRVFVLNESAFKDRLTPTTGQKDRGLYIIPERWPRYARTLQSLFLSRRSDFSALFLVPNLGRANTGEASFDRRYDEYYARVERPLIFEASTTRFWAKPDQSYERFILSQDALWISAFVKGKIWQLPRPVEEQINAFAEFVAKLYNIPAQQSYLAALMTRYVKMYHDLKPVFARFIAPRVQHRLALVEDAAYLGQEAVKTKILHDLGFHVAEPQHGIIMAWHCSYNFPPEILENPSHPAQAYLPDTFLMHGAYWATFVHMPGAKVIIGYPHLSKTVEQVSSHISAVASSILVLSQPNITDKAVQLTQDLARAFPESAITIKMHPNELQSASRFAPLGVLPNVQVIGHMDVYKLVAANEIIVGFSTTVLVEACAFPGKRIFFNEFDIVPNSVGDCFTDSESLIDLIRDPVRGFPRCQPDQFWASDWQERLNKFLEVHLTDKQV